MTRDEIFDFIKQNLHANPEFLFEKFPNIAVFKKRKKWFGVLMQIPLSKLSKSAQDSEIIEVLNIKAPRDLVSILSGTRGIYPAYHMNKKLWLSLAISEVDEKLIKDLIKQSFELV